MFSKLNFLQRVFLAMIFIMLLASFYFHANLGGTGFRIPNNIFVWLFGGLAAFIGVIQLTRNKVFYLPQYFWLMMAFPVLALFSGMISGVNSASDWFLRLFFIWGGLLFLFALFQQPYRGKHLDIILLAITCCGFFHAVIGLTQIILVADIPGWLPLNSSGDPTGLFQQINNQASFQVTTTLICIWLLSRPVSRRSLWVKVFLLAVVFFASTIIFASASRVGFLGLIIALPLMFLSRWKWLWQNKITVVSLSVIIIAAFLSNNLHSSNIDKLSAKTDKLHAGYSGEARMGIYKITFDELIKSPLTGHGIGTFARVWQNAKPAFYAEFPDATLPSQRVSHPHNELILWLLEGGLIAAAGLVLFLLGVLLTLYKLPSSRRYAYAALLLPIGLHTQVELPFYISALHWFVFIILIFILLHSFRRAFRKQLSVAANNSIKHLSLSGIFGLVIFSAHTYASSLEFKDYIIGKANSDDPFTYAMENPYFKRLATHAVMTSMYKSSVEYGIRENIEAFADWAEQQMKFNPQIGYFKLAVDSRLKLSEQKQACDIAKQANNIYPLEKDIASFVNKCELMSHSAE